MTPALLDHLTAEDLALLARVAAAAGEGRLGPADLRARPGLVEQLVARPDSFAAVFGPAHDDPFLRASPFLVFVLALHRAGRDLKDAASVPDRVGPRQRVAVFDAAELRAFLARREYRLFLAELLASYTRVASGVVWQPTGRGPRRRRFSELDPVRLASLLEVVPESERAGVYRRLGDLALFLSGVFPDHTARFVFGPLDGTRLLRAARLSRPDDRAVVLGRHDVVDGPGRLELMEELGRRWYRLACLTAVAPSESLRVAGEVGERFRQARRILNLLADRHLLPFRAQWFAPPRG